MSIRSIFVLVMSALIPLMSETMLAGEGDQIVRLARLDIYPTHLEDYKTALKEEIETSVRIEPGVLTLNAVAGKDDPTRITLLEIYADAEAYRKHLESPHFLKYKQLTQSMVKSLELTETVPILLRSKLK